MPWRQTARLSAFAELDGCIPGFGTAATRNAKNMKSYFTKDVCLFLVLGLLGLVVAAMRCDVFPSASVNIKVSKKQALQLANKYADIAGFSNVMDSSVYFHGDSQAKTFLEYELGVAEANRLMSSNEVPVWSWDIHQRKDGDDAAYFDANIGMDGSVLGFENHIPNDTRMSSISHAAAEQLATRIIEREFNTRLSDWKMISDKEVTLSTRTEHFFIWEQQKDYKGGHVRLSAEVVGDTLASAQKYLHVPDTFSHKFEGLRAQNNALSRISFGIALAAAASLIFVFIRAVVNGQLRPKILIVSGFTCAIVIFLSKANDALFVAVSTVGWDASRWVGVQLVNGLAYAVQIGLLAAIAFGAIEVVYRQHFPKQPALERFLDGTAWRLPSVFKSALLGLALFPIWIAYQTVFYLIGFQFGAFLPLGVREAQVMSGWFPAWDAIETGISASMLEEFGFRIFLIAVFQRFTRSFWIANFLQATIWGFGHCNYAAEPPYVRGVELTFEGLWEGWIMQRYGFVALVMSHYAFDAFLSVIPLIGSSIWSDKVSALLAVSPVVILPVLCWYLIKKKGPTDEESLSNASIKIEVVETAAEAAEDIPGWQPIDARLRKLLLIFAVVFGLLSLIPPRQIGAVPQFAVDRTKAIAIARNYFESHGIDLKGYQPVAYISGYNEKDGPQYVFEKVNFQRAKELAEQLGPENYWWVRFLKTGEQRSFAMGVSPEGTPKDISINLPEGDAGASLSKDDAFKAALDFLHASIGKDASRLELKGTQKINRPARVDYKFSVEDPGYKIEDSNLTYDIVVSGDKVTRTDRNWTVAEHWKEKRDGKGWSKIALAVSLLAATVLLFNVVYWIFQILKLKSVNWKVVTLVTSIVVLCRVIRVIDYNVAMFFATYSPSEPLETLWVDKVYDVLREVVAMALGAGLLSAVVTGSLSWLHPTLPFKELSKRTRTFLTNSSFWTDAILISFCTAAFMSFSGQLLSVTLSLFSPKVQFLRLDYLRMMNGANPLLEFVVTTLFVGVGAALCVATIEAWRRYFSLDLGQLAILGLMAICAINSQETVPTNILIYILCTTLACMGGFYLVGCVGRCNPVIILLSVVFAEIASFGFELWRIARFNHMPEIIGLAVAILLPALWLCIRLMLAHTFRISVGKN